MLVHGNRIAALFNHSAKSSYSKVCQAIQSISKWRNSHNYKKGLGFYGLRWSRHCEWDYRIWEKSLNCGKFSSSPLPPIKMTTHFCILVAMVLIEFLFVCFCQQMYYVVWKHCHFPIVGTRPTIVAFAILKTSLSRLDVVLIPVLPSKVSTK